MGRDFAAPKKTKALFANPQKMALKSKAMAPKIKALVIGESVVVRKEDDPNFRKIFPLSWKFMIDSYLKGWPASEIYAEGLRRNDPVRLVDLAELTQELKGVTSEKPKIRRGLRELDLSPSWLDVSIFSVGLIGERWVMSAKMILFYLLGLAVVGASLWQLTLPHMLGGFLHVNGTFAMSLVGLVSAMTLLAISKSLILLALNYFGTGSLPEVRFVYRGLFFDLHVDPSVMDAGRDRTTRMIYYLVSAHAFIAAALVWKRLPLPGLDAESWVTVAFLMTFVSLNPKTKGETSNIFGILFPQWKAKRFLSYLENRALFAMFRRGRWVDDESRLLLFAVLCVGWSVGVLYFISSLFTENFSLLKAEIQTAGGAAWFSVGFIVAIFALVIGLVLLELWRVLIRNFLFLFQRQIQNWRRNRSVRTERDFDPVKLRHFLTASPLFQGYPAEVIDAFIAEGHIQVLRPGHPIVIQGNVGKDLFVILEGEAAVRKQDAAGEIHEVARFSKGAVFGEIALLRNIVRTASVVALSPVRVFVLPKTHFQKIFEGLDSAKSLERRIALTGVLGDSSVFMNMPKETLAVLLGYGHFVEFQPGQLVMEQGDPEKDFYILLRGHVDVMRGGQFKIGEIGPGGFFGEMALFENRPRSASIRARDEAVALRLSREAFWKMVDQDIQLAAQIQEVSWLRRQAPEAASL